MNKRKTPPLFSSYPNPVKKIPNQKQKERRMKRQQNKIK